ncbi:hypothetical protein ACIBO5_39120 [Nonomuraea angiospora]|uniref:hypothetical protein n=1 Tax=Nonomuraea angiospora TaxID=46172 RepID=UPI0029B3EC6B|nr:hypothetical protein [Nonomuraea angiospora]MDX3102274.1 hypothetical protein [Nonomuraea angiospora]
MDLSKPGTPSVAQRLPERVVFAGVVGAMLPLLHIGWALLGAALADESRCGHFGCIEPLVEAWEIGRWLVPVLAWPLLGLLRVRPAWHVALVAPLFLVPLWELSARPEMLFGVLSTVLAYPFAALVTAPGASWRQRGLGVALFLLLCGALAVPG